MHSVLPTLYSFLFLWLYIIRYVFLSYIKCVTSCAIQAREEKKCHYVYHFSLLMCMIWCTHIQKAMSFSLTHVLFFRRRKERGKQEKKGKCQKKSFRRRHLFSAAAMVPSVILYSETVMLFILVHYLWKYKFTTQFLYRRFLFLYSYII